MAVDSYIIESPANAFLQSLKIAEVGQQQRTAQARQQQLQQAVKALQQAPSPEAYANFYLQFPEMKEQIEAYRSTLGEADKNTLTSAAREAMIATKAGKMQDIPAIFDRYATIAENSSRPDLVKQFKDAKRIVEQYPDAGKFAVESFFQGVDPDGYKILADSDLKLDTAIIKNLVAEGMAPGSPEFKAALKQERESITVTDPNIGFYHGSPEGLQQILQARGLPAPATTQRGLPRITSPEEAKKLPPGSSFIDPNGVVRQVPGGAGGNASAGFP